MFHHLYQGQIQCDKECIRSELLKRKIERKPATSHKFLYKGCRLGRSIISSENKLLYEDQKEYVNRGKILQHFF